MADLKFHCPECDQKILVDDSAAGMQIDCPSCRSALLIPAQAGTPAQVVTRRQQAVGAGAAGSAYEELDRKQRDLTAALDEAAQLRTESDRARTEVNRLRDDLAATARERDGLRATGLEFNRLKDEESRFKIELEKTREELTRERQERETLARRLAAQEAAQRNAELLSLAAAPESGPHALQERLAAGEKERGALQAQLAEAQQSIEAERAKAAKHAGRVAAVEREREELRDHLTAAGESSANLGALQNDLAKLRGELDATTKALGTVKAEADQSAQNLAEVRKNLKPSPMSATTRASRWPTGKRLCKRLR